MGSNRPTVGDLRSLGNFSQMFRWMVRVVQFPTLLGNRYNSDQINFRAESMSIPEKTGETTTITIRGNEVRQPGIYRWNSPITLTLVETTDIVINKFIWDWMDVCWQTLGSAQAVETLAPESPGLTGDNADIKATISLYQLDNLDHVIYQHIVYGCFIESATLGQFDSSTSDPQKPEISLAYDFAVRTANHGSDNGGEGDIPNSGHNGQVRPVTK